MRPAFRLLLIGLVAMLSVTPLLPAQSDRAARGWFRCDTNTGGDTIYATPFFDWTGTFDVLQNAFEQHLLAKYGYTGRVACSMASPGGNTLANLQTDMQRQYSQFRAQGKKIVELSWTILSPGVTLAYQCFGLAKVRRAGVPDSSYLLHSEPVRIKVDNGDELGNAWTDELKRLHPGWYFQSPGCNLLPADPAKYPAFLNSMVEMWAGSKPKVVQLDWQYQTGAAAATAEADAQPAYYCELIGSTPKTVFITPVRAADPGWERMDYQYAWQQYVRANLDKDAYTGGCEAGTMKQETVARNGRRENYVNQGYTIRDVDWTYTPGAKPASAKTPAPATATPPPAPAAAPAAAASKPGFPTIDGLGRPYPPTTFYCQYLGLALDASGKYPLYQAEPFTIATGAGAVQNAWKTYIESTYHPSSPGNPMCVMLPTDPAQREGVLNSFNLLTQPATQKVVKVAWKP
jgi:hypothetical protein